MQRLILTTAYITSVKFFSLNNEWNKPAFIILSKHISVPDMYYSGFILENINHGTGALDVHLDLRSLFI